MSLSFCLLFRTKDNKTPLQLAIQCHLQPVVDALCQKGADLNNCDEKNNCPLWVALKSGQQDIAATLVSLLMFVFFSLSRNTVVCSVERLSYDFEKVFAVCFTDQCLARLKQNFSLFPLRKLLIWAVNSSIAQSHYCVSNDINAKC